MFKKSLLSELITLTFPDIFNNFASIILQSQESGPFDSIIALKNHNDVDQVSILH